MSVVAKVTVTRIDSSLLTSTPQLDCGDKREVAIEPLASLYGTMATCLAYFCFILYTLVYFDVLSPESLVKNPAYRTSVDVCG